MTPLPDAPAAPTAPRQPARRLRRFSRAERWVHRGTAWLMGICVFTAACLYLPPLSELVGRRRLVVTVHEWSGLMLPAPLIAGMFFRALRADLSRLNRFGRHDWHWLRTVLRKRSKEGVPAGKFNAGQKLYSAFIAGAVLVMIGTGLLMWFTHLAPVLWRTGATFVHDWLALLLAAGITGHVWMASKDPEARLGMRTGSVASWWARREHSLWKPDDKD
ncbi:formate dehydrogenase [Streptomyces sp. SID13666]|uniref:cytochrome b/b6 domain-containing protein n=1 Tax=Streptomyces TaxID=1883 RepID=UPI0011057873|nr:MULTISPECIES: cytochrome b/b6 domain-containing protein [Streptomyces]MCZ4101477.1 cytochrome b/b6 domain-containing protein [Streptomyces sp. H39-C1]NEA56073.1 formate dehydrogenase [Streptomyces sp. SID13666]NEA71946.1 formate dehydrogenase [Streptomyces sp. SID13588]QNA72160.1 formate dehydrogenase [Streptomyces sp. So13.3]